MRNFSRWVMSQSVQEAVISMVDEAITKWPTTRQAFEWCLKMVRRKTASVHTDAALPSSDESQKLFLFILKAYRKMRGKDFVKSILASKKHKSANTNSSRGTLAAAATAAFEKRKTISSSLSSSSSSSFSSSSSSSSSSSVTSQLIVAGSKGSQNMLKHRPWSTSANRKAW